MSVTNPLFMLQTNRESGAGPKTGEHNPNKPRYYGSKDRHRNGEFIQEDQANRSGGGKLEVCVCMGVRRRKRCGKKRERWFIVPVSRVSHDIY